MVLEVTRAGEAAETAAIPKRHDRLSSLLKAQAAATERSQIPQDLFMEPRRVRQAGRLACFDLYHLRY